MILDGKFDDAIKLCDSVLAKPNLHPQIKTVTESLKDNATKAKASGAKPAGQPAGPKQVDIK
jgi:hypothetical protein